MRARIVGAFVLLVSSSAAAETKPVLCSSSAYDQALSRWENALTDLTARLSSGEGGMDGQRTRDGCDAGTTSPLERDLESLLDGLQAADEQCAVDERTCEPFAFCLRQPVGLCSPSEVGAQLAQCEKVLEEQLGALPPGAPPLIQCSGGQRGCLLRRVAADRSVLLAATRYLSSCEEDGCAAVKAFVKEQKGRLGAASDALRRAEATDATVQCEMGRLRNLYVETESQWRPKTGPRIGVAARGALAAGSHTLLQASLVFEASHSAAQTDGLVISIGRVRAGDMPDTDYEIPNHVAGLARLDWGQMSGPSLGGGFGWKFRGEDQFFVTPHVGWLITCPWALHEDPRRRSTCAVSDGWVRGGARVFVEPWIPVPGDDRNTVVFVGLEVAPAVEVGEPK